MEKITFANFTEVIKIKILMDYILRVDGLLKKLVPVRNVTCQKLMELMTECVCKRWSRFDDVMSSHVFSTMGLLSMGNNIQCKVYNSFK